MHLVRRRGRGAFTTRGTAVIRRRLFTDGGLTWEPVETLISDLGSFSRNPIAVLSNADWLFPIYYNVEAPSTGDPIDYSTVQISEDAGQTWTEFPIPNSGGRVQASVLELDPGQLIAFFRSRAADNIYGEKPEAAFCGGGEWQSGGLRQFTAEPWNCGAAKLARELCSRRLLP